MRTGTGERRTTPTAVVRQGRPVFDRHSDIFSHIGAANASNISSNRLNRNTRH